VHRKHKQATKLGPYEGYLKQRIGEGVLNTRKLLRELKARGYQGGLTQLILYVQPYRTSREERAVLRFETLPGQQAQVDWGSFGYISHEGRQQRLYAFVMTLGYSRMLYLEFTTRTDVSTWLRCHQHAFEYFGGVPEEMLHDKPEDRRSEAGERVARFTGTPAIWTSPCTMVSRLTPANRIALRPRAKWNAVWVTCVRTSGWARTLSTWTT